MHVRRSDERNERGMNLGVVLTLMVLLELGLCQQCPPSSVAFSVIATPSCYSYGLCFRGHYSGSLACPPKTGFDPAKGGCTVEAYNACSAREGQTQTQLSCRIKTTDTFYPDYSRGCPSSDYFLCRNGVVSFLSCSVGLFFDEGTDTCVAPSVLSCGAVGPVCGAGMSGRGVAVYPDYTQGCPTSQFVVCTADGPMTGLSCPQGLFYNGAIKSCDYIDNIVCSKNVLVLKTKSVV